MVWEAFVEETKVVRVAVNWFMGEENLDPPQHAQNEMRAPKSHRSGTLSHGFCASLRCLLASRQMGPRLK